MDSAYRVRGEQGSGDIWALAFDYRGILAAIPLAYAFFSTRWEWENETAIWLIAVLLCASGAALRGWARCHLRYGRRAKKTLAATGPYSFVRNPLYLGNLLVIAGAGVASELEWLLPVVVLWAFAVYNAAVRYEETRLSQKYGAAYIAYRKEVPAWVPRLRRTGAPRGSIRIREFLPVAGAQLAYSLLILLPFLLKEFNPLQLWPHP